MLGANEVSDVHDVEFILYRDQNTQPEIEWQENQCFKLIFDSPYTVDPESWAPFDSATPPACTVSYVLCLGKRMSAKSFTVICLVFDFSSLFKI